MFFFQKRAKDRKYIVLCPRNNQLFAFLVFLVLPSRKQVSRAHIKYLWAAFAPSHVFGLSTVFLEAVLETNALYYTFKKHQKSHAENVWVLKTTILRIKTMSAVNIVINTLFSNGNLPCPRKGSALVSICECAGRISYTVVLTLLQQSMVHRLWRYFLRKSFQNCLISTSTAWKGEVATM